MTFKKHRGTGVATPGRSTKSCRGRCSESKCIRNVKTVSGARIIFCSLCGAYGSQKAIKLRHTCEPQDNPKRQPQWIKRRHPVSKEAFVDFKKQNMNIGEPMCSVSQQMLFKGRQKNAADRLTNLRLVTHFRF